MNEVDSRDLRQQELFGISIERFGHEHATSPTMRGLRFIEECIEAIQAAGVDKDQVHKLLDYVYAKPVGDIYQEIGAAGLTLLLFAQACGISASRAEIAETERVKAMDPKEHSERNKAKNEAGFDAKAYPTTERPIGKHPALAAPFSRDNPTTEYDAVFDDRVVERRALDSSHFAGTDRRMGERRAR